jgi:chromosome segregation ATPase
MDTCLPPHARIPTPVDPGVHQVKAFKEAEGVEKKVEGELQAATKTAQGLTEKVNKVASALKDAQAQEKALAEKVKAIESALEKAKEQVGPAGRKSTELLQDLNVKKREADDAALVVKQKQALAEAAANKAKAAKAQAKL